MHLALRQVHHRKLLQRGPGLQRAVGRDHLVAVAPRLARPPDGPSAGHPHYRVLLSVQERDLDVGPHDLIVGVAVRLCAHRRNPDHAVVQDAEHRAQVVAQVMDGGHVVRPRLLRPGDLVKVLQVDELARLEVPPVPARVLAAHVLALDVPDVPQPARPDQVAPRRYEPAVPQLLPQQVDEARPLLGRDDSPAVLHRVGGRHLGVDVLARLQRHRRHRPLLLAANAQRDGVHVPVGEHLLVAAVSRHAAAVVQLAQGPLVQLREHVADRRDPVAVHPVQDPQPVDPPVSDPVDADANLVHLSYLRMPRPWPPWASARRPSTRSA